MNFTQEIKRELVKTLPESRCCRCALLSAVLDTSGEWALSGDGGRLCGGFSFTSESEEIATYLLDLAERLFGIRMTVSGAVRDPKHGRDKLTFSWFGEGGGDFADEITDHSPANPIEECCARAYLKGAFLGGGSCTLPHEGKRTGYHLEIVLSCDFAGYAAEDLCALLERFRLAGSIVTRGEKYVVYLKSREAIAGFLSVIGARGALKTLEKVSASREVSNNENRVLNCMGNNADRSAIASAEQVVAFARLREEGILGALPEPLKEAAEARLAHPEMTLSELAEALSLSKSCLNHRLRRLMGLRRAEEKKERAADGRPRQSTSKDHK